MNQHISTATSQPRSILFWVALLGPCVMTMGLALDLYLPAIPLLPDALQITPIDAQLTLSSYMVAYGLGQLLCLGLINRFSRRTFLVISLCLFGLACLQAYICTTFEELIGARVMQALGACGASVVAMAIIREQFDGHQATIAYTRLRALLGLAPMISPLIGVGLMQYGNWQTPFLALSAFSLCMVVAVLRLMPQSTQAESNEDEAQRQETTVSACCEGVKRFFDRLSLALSALRSIVTNPQFIRYTTTGFLTQGTMFAFFSLSPLIYMTTLGLSKQAFALAFGANGGIFLLVGSFIAPRKAHLPKGELMRFAARLYLIGGLIMYVMPLIMPLSWSHLALGNAFAAVASAFMLGINASGAMAPFKAQAGFAASIFGALEFLLGGLIGGSVIWLAPTALWPLACLLITVAAFTHWLSYFKDSAAH